MGDTAPSGQSESEGMQISIFTLIFMFYNCSNKF